MSEWQPIETAPTDGAPFIARDNRDGAEYAAVVRFEPRRHSGGVDRFPIVDMAEGQRYASAFFNGWLPLPAIK